MTVACHPELTLQVRCARRLIDREFELCRALARTEAPTMCQELSCARRLQDEARVLLAWHPSSHQLIGWALLREDRLMLFVDPGHRGQGVGTWLMDELLQRRPAHCRSDRWRVCPTSPQSQRFCARHQQLIVDTSAVSAPAVA